MKYLTSSVEGHKIKIAGESIEFDKAKSNRLRISTENLYQINQEVGVIAGVAYEHEFDGKASGTALGRYRIPEPSVKGDTGIATVGLRYHPVTIPNFTVDLKASGYFGKREGGVACYI